MSEPDKNLQIRLSIAEVKIHTIEEDLLENKSVLKEIVTKVESVREHFAKMNGTLPHIEATCNDIKTHLEFVMRETNEQSNKIIKNSLYLKILWSLVIPIALTIIGATIKIMFFG